MQPKYALKVLTQFSEIHSTLAIEHFDAGDFAVLTQVIIFFIRLPPEFLPVLGTLTRSCVSTLGAALLCSSRAGSDYNQTKKLMARHCS